MIELTQIKTSDQIKALRGQLNTAFGEIVSDQMIIGNVVNPSIAIYDEDYETQIGAVTASSISGLILAVCMPESNGVFIADLFGHIEFPTPTLTTSATAAILKIDIPSVHLPSRTSNVSTFVTPQHLGYGGCIPESMKPVLTELAEGNCLTQLNRLAVVYGGTNAQSTMGIIEEHDSTCNYLLPISLPR